MSLSIIIPEAIKTSAIEGEFPNRKDVLSPIWKAMVKEKVHYEALPSFYEPEELKRFIKWLN